MDIPDGSARELIGPRAEYYLARWARIGGPRGPALGFNWPAFFVTPFWMLYRRMYVPFWITGGAVLVLAIVETLIASALGLARVPSDVDRVLNIATAATCGVFGSYWYYLDVRRKYRKLVAAGDTSSERFRALGGVDWVWPGVALLIVVLSVAITLLLPTH